MASNVLLVLVCVAFFGALDGALGVRKDPSSSDRATHVSSPGGTCKSRVEIFGYKCEEHTVTTEDGYILSLQRIPNGRSGATMGGNKTPVLLQHGILMDGTTWLLNSPDESLGYILADNGYDVWIANSRGTIYSLGHTSLSPTDPEYWNWTWDELVAYDLPATFNYVYTQTGQKQLHYVGYSLGTLMAFASFSERNTLSMLKSAALLSPIAYLDQVTTPLVRAAVDIFLTEIAYWLGIDQFDPIGKVVHDFLLELCKQPDVNCFSLMTSLTGKNCCLNSSSVNVLLDHEPQSTSTKNLVHLSQMVRSGTITKYDYGDAIKNMMHYGQTTPPAYNISNIPNDVPLFISHGGQDELSDVKDVERLLNNNLDKHDSDKLNVQYVDNYAHVDFVMGTNARQAVYNPLMAFFKLQQ